jgi:hypothetical protein
MEITVQEEMEITVQGEVTVQVGAEATAQAVVPATQVIEAAVLLLLCLKTLLLTSAPVFKLVGDLMI